ncbi:MAG: hypothetical protein WAW42_10910 [Candidatus Competibacteraceae bacterium]
MKIQSFSDTRVRSNEKLVLQTAGSQTTTQASAVNVYQFVYQFSSADTASTEPKNDKEKPLSERISIARKKAMDVGGMGGIVLTGLNAVTPQQVAGVLQQYHLAANPDAALYMSNNILDSVQSKACNIVAIGMISGTVSYVVIDSLKPGWSTSTKLAISGAIAVAVFAALSYFTSDDKGSQPSPPAVTTLPKS